MRGAASGESPGGAPGGSSSGTPAPGTGPPPSARIDPAALERLSEWGGGALRSRIIGLFLENAPERMEAIREGLAEERAGGEDAPELAERSAHSLASSAANVGAHMLATLSRRMESALVGGSRERTVQLLSAMETEMEVVMEEFKRIQEREGAG